MSILSSTKTGRRAGVYVENLYDYSRDTTGRILLNTLCIKRDYSKRVFLQKYQGKYVQQSICVHAFKKIGNSNSNEIVMSKTVQVKVPNIVLNHKKDINNATDYIAKSVGNAVKIAIRSCISDFDFVVVSGSSWDEQRNYYKYGYIPSEIKKKENFVL